MIGFQDTFTGDIVMSDKHPYTLKYNDVVMEVKPSYASEQALQIEESQETGFEGEGELERVSDGIEYQYAFIPTSFTKVEFLNEIRAFKYRIKDHLEKTGNYSRYTPFQEGMDLFIKAILGRFDELNFFMGSSGDTSGAIIISHWEYGADPRPVFYFFNDALKKVSL